MLGLVLVSIHVSSVVYTRVNCQQVSTVKKCQLSTSVNDIALDVHSSSGRGSLMLIDDFVTKDARRTDYGVGIAASTFVGAC